VPLLAGAQCGDPQKAPIRRNPHTTSSMKIVPDKASEVPAPARIVAPTDAAVRISARLASVDAYRGLVMFLMMAEVLRLSEVASAHPESSVWRFLAWHQTHVPWFGCTLHDLIQPSFSLLVGVALPFSLASRLSRGQSPGRATLHAAWRALALVFLGIFLRSIGKPQTNYTFEDTLTQIGLGYLPLFILAFGPPRLWWGALVAILIGYWGAFALYPLPAATFDTAVVGVPPDWPHNFAGFASHWNKNTNAAWAFDTWFLNLFPRERLFTHNGGGYATLSFIPTLGTMILGLIAGDWLRQREARRTIGKLVVAGAGLLIAGLALHHAGVGPIVKRIWTPSWTLFSGGWCFLILAGFYALIDVLGYRRWAFPLCVIGMNSIAAYCMAHLFEPFIVDSFKTHLGAEIFQFAGEALAPFVTGVAVLVIYWLILFWMYRRRIFLKI
jgi:heparan-alpha-glucosaminide N-acetyltransferase